MSNWENLPPLSSLDKYGVERIILLATNDNQGPAPVTLPRAKPAKGHQGFSRKEKVALLTSKCSNVVNLEEEKQQQGGRGENQDRQHPVLLSPPASLAARL